MTFTVTPQITSLSASSVPVNASITITGTGFGANQPGGNPVTFNGVSANPTGWTDASIVVPVPAAATTGPVIVTLSGVPSDSRTFTVTAGITSLSLTQGPVQMGIVITGTNLGTTKGTSTVKLNTIAMPIVSWSATAITVQVPAGATSGNIVVTVSGHASNGAAFTVSPAFGCS